MIRLLAVSTICFGLLFGLVACDQQEAEPLPTLAPVEPTPTQEEMVEATSTPQPTATEFVRPTLPPTWTPTPSPTPTLSAEEQAAADGENGVPAPPAAATINPACGVFGPDRERMDTEFDVGESPRIAWTGVEGAALYRVIITNESGFEVHNVLIEETFLDVNPDVFAQPGPYGWDVLPLDPFGIQMCIGRGDMLLAQ